MDLEDNVPLEVEGKQYEVIDEVTVTQFEAEGEQYEVIDEVTDTQLESEDDLTEEGVTTRLKSPPEMQPAVTEDVKTEQGKFKGSIKQAKDGGEGANEDVAKKSDVENIPDVINTDTKDPVDSHQTEVENKHFNSKQNMTESQAVPESSGKTDENSVNTEEKQANKPEKKGETVIAKSLKAVIQPPPSKQPMSWDSNVLLIEGLYPGVSEAYE
jgi:hypothetical protein